ncbi:MAG: metallophosphoesterase [Bacteroidetes bacterium]|nr:MAG: metallophosphoesterase [Bacteroidota bacterium]
MQTALLQGTAKQRPPVHKSQAHPGVHPLSPLSHATQRFQPLPAPIKDPPYHYDLTTAIPDIEKAAALIFHTVGDTGGIKNGSFQAAVAGAMKADLNLPANQKPAFFYHLGDVVYYNGQTDDYYDQFYDPYDHYNAPIFSIPGNHDGDPIDSSQTSLDGWVRYFMTQNPQVDPLSKDAPRVTMSQPYVYFTLECPFATVVGLYTNVPEHGSIDSQQQQWLTNELATAPDGKALIVCLHHPIYSFDDHHSGSPNMADVLQNAINDSRRIPNIVLTAHVHNYQHIEKKIGDSTIPFIVAGNGGYYHMHNLNSPEGTTDASTGAKLIKANDKLHGYLTLKVDGRHVSGTSFLVDNGSGNTSQFEQFQYPAGALRLAQGATAAL